MPGWKDILGCRRTIMKQKGRKRISTSGWETTMTKYHDSFSQAMVPYRGRILQTAEILRISWLFPAMKAKRSIFNLLIIG
jgi:hypothetical protein